ncbi:hypothetical protein KTD31_01645 [Burkholderia multivorans]|jgi:hypothetical protein|uniref:hypothetical protein n=1 Tax=Burkholderia multivorans TaxID=87883 RepID=UPI001C24BE98|nr:hypothetical protein [Burkholderia multivorans]MBU9200106.1 hypothetical protein [Burkholderia multivorans]MDN8078772.1 hypothetical protein [Burkholderia multivorans]
MSHQGLASPRPEWLGQLTEVQVSPEQAAGRSETGAALAALADAMGGAEGDEPFALGELMGVEIRRGTDASPEFAMMVSSGNAQADVERVAKAYAVDSAAVFLLSAYVMLTLDTFSGLAQLKPLS